MFARPLRAYDVKLAPEVEAPGYFPSSPHQLSG